MASGDVYAVTTSQATWTATTPPIIELVTSSSYSGVEILRVSLGQSSNTASAMNVAILSTFTGVASGGSGGTIVKFHPGTGTASTSAYVGRTSAGSGEAALIREAFNELTGWLWVPGPDDRIFIPKSGYFGVRFSLTNASMTAISTVVFREL